MSYLKRTFPGFQKWAYNFAGFNQYGLYRDDLLHETEDVKEALKRVPPHIIEERDFRLVRAMQLDLQKKVLPKEQWTKLEEDIHYLLPHVQDVIRERKEKEAWEAQ
ncbi:Cytochrome b-c1 complex subunit 7 [Habropoda laboriosa]|uniref:Cytochrome b-c1 complex subunit 7 n=1 Tax=Habropoda laboriosa TaxID=597456 RepID=A0A0L7R3M4_9HYME|nr:PREDICTED: cytochrome b-c1 complex subunit 7-like [Habropoda laboriosa]KOC65490.1 Cytochrome b-c1 complex subunit 7 [Habropoda laboriosa]